MRDNSLKTKKKNKWLLFEAKICFGGFQFMEHITADDDAFHIDNRAHKNFT